MTLAKSYEPYGTVLTSNGTASSIFAYAGEQIDTYIKLLFLRARYLNPRLGIFLARDPWGGDQMRPGSMNGFNYGEGNPVNATDPSGQIACFPPNHWVVEYDWSEGHVEEVWKCVPWGSGSTQSPLPSIFGTVESAGSGTNPAGAIIGGVLILAYLCYEAVAQPGTQTQSRDVDWPRPPREREATPTPFPPPWPEPTKPPLQLHISLGRGEWLVMFTYYLNRKLNPQNIFVYDFLSWKDARLSDEEARASNLEWTFPQATSRAEHIHFNLEGIDEPNQYAQEMGNQGKFPGKFGESYITAIELYNVKHTPGLCAKTSFYEKGSTNQTPSAIKWTEVCGG